MAKGLTVNKTPGKKGITGTQSLSQLSQELRNLKSRVPVWMSIESIPVMEEFENLFRIKDINLEKITESIRNSGFDEKFSLIIAAFPDGTRSLIAGFTRKAGASASGMKDVPTWTVDFPSIEAAIEWALHEQYDRRNLSDDEIYESVLRIDEFTKKGINGFQGKSSVLTAEIAGISARKVEQIRTVDQKGTEEQKEAVRTGQKSVNQTYREIANKRKAQCCASSAAENPTERNWSVEVRGSNIVLIRDDDSIPLVNFQAMNLLYNGAPVSQLKKAVEDYMSKRL